MKRKAGKTLLLVMVFVACAVLNYNPQMLFKSSYYHWGWNFSLLATILIILIMKRRDPQLWKQKLGIDFSRKDIIWFVLTTAVLLVVSYFLVSYVTGFSRYSFKPQLFYYKEYFSENFPFSLVLASYLYYIPETFNEEMIIGALLLLGLNRHYPRIGKTVIAILVAVIFSLMHQLMYKWSPVQPGTILTVKTVLTLFFVGVLRNVFILKTRKITYSWAIHLSFNFIFFAGLYVDVASGTFASEPDKFNIVFGNWLMLGLTGTLAFASLLWLNVDRLKNISNAGLKKVEI